jgi:hypothetical protein
MEKLDDIELLIVSTREKPSEDDEHANGELNTCLDEAFSIYEQFKNLGSYEITFLQTSFVGDEIALGSVIESTALENKVHVIVFDLRDTSSTEIEGAEKIIELLEDSTHGCIVLKMC